MSATVFSVTIAGKPMSAGASSRVTSITITSKAGKDADTCSIILDDKDGAIALPDIKQAVSVSLGGGAVEFSGTIDEVKSTGGRGQGHMLEISAKSADTTGKLKEPAEKHHDKATLKDVAAKWGKDAGLSDVKVDETLGAIERDYWSMANETFLSWANRIAREVGATFKVLGDKAALVPRSAGKSASGKALAPITGRWGEGGNLISWSISPKIGRPQYQKFDVRYFDPQKAKFMRETVEAKASEGTSTATDRFRAIDQASARKRGESLDKEADREKGGGSATIDGNGMAQPEAEFTLVNVRPGIDGAYRIESVIQKYERSSGWQTTLEVKQPAGEAGKDSRGKASAGTGNAGNAAPPLAPSGSGGSSVGTPGFASPGARA